MLYRQLSPEKQIFVQKNAEKNLTNLGKLIFDFDGVLVQTSQSYRQTIKKVVDYYFLRILKLEGKEGKLVNLYDIQKFKDTGLYNNDWNLSYTFISYYLSLIIEILQQKGILKEFFQKINGLQFQNLQNFIQDLTIVSHFLNNYNIKISDLIELKDNEKNSLDLFITKSISKQLKKIKKSAINNSKSEEFTQKLLEKLVPFHLEKPDLLKQLFEEIYLGSDLYQKFYGVTSFFKFNGSFLDNEKLISTKQTMEELKGKFGKFGIYSGRPKVQGFYILEKYNYSRYFSKSASRFLGNLFKSEFEMEKFGKPDPTLFIDLIQEFEENGASIAYVGDGVADAVLIENARSKGIDNLFFIGVMSSSEDSNKLFTEYTKHGASAIITDVNEIPFIFKILEGSD